METTEVLTDAEECLAQTTALDRAHAAELLSVASTAMSGATDVRR